MFKLKIVTDFAAAHQLSTVSKKCENLHGHNWKIEVCVVGEKLNKAGLLVDFREIKKRVKKIIGELDHKFLNEIEYFGDSNPPSSENIALHIAKSLQSSFKVSGVTVSEVSAWESEDACATYINDRQSGH